MMLLMPLPLEDYVRQVLLENGRGAKIHEAVAEGWAAFQSLYPQRHQWRRKSSSRHMMWEEVAQRLAVIAADDQGIDAVEHQDTLSLIVEGAVLIRLKHADTTLITQNFPTAEARAFDDHEQDLFGYAGLQRVRLCYVLNRYETALLWVGIAAHDKGSFLWKLELEAAGAVQSIPQLPLPAPTEDTSRFARIKRSASDQDQANKKRNG
ncbi:hypothetical protein [Acuticoccus mangrovi]|uniref:Uncharacterized protein n=1 Tax=Acuticoccus mangrovi TaxID=2796142 RepID=A0A934MIU0_9HYPH|nr:hypothetical protein [Acuticoccus mangrovi]MBJ3777551.1 hypothetical protein [Acuticoccus mangrovi]